MDDVRIVDILRYQTDFTFQEICSMTIDHGLNRDGRVSFVFEERKPIKLTESVIRGRMRRFIDEELDRVASKRHLIGRHGLQVTDLVLVVADVFRCRREHEDLLRTMIDLSHTPPGDLGIVGTSMRLVDTGLIARMWLASYVMFGAHWAKQGEAWVDRLGPGCMPNRSNDDERMATWLIKKEAVIAAFRAQDRLSEGMNRFDRADLSNRLYAATRNRFRDTI